MTLDRRRVLQVVVSLVPVLQAGTARGTPAALDAAVQAFTGGATVRDGRVTLEIAELIENGNAVPVTVGVEDGLGAGNPVHQLALFTERNPQPEVAVFHVTPAMGRARVATRVRLATSQRVIALARLADGTCWRRQVDVLVTLAACVEG